MPILRPNQLPAASTPLAPTDLIVVDQGAGGVNAADPQDVVDVVAPVASLAEAEAGSDNIKRMTSLRTKQSVASEVGVTLASKAQGDLADSSVQPARQVVAGAGLTGGGALSSDVTLNVGAGTGITVEAESVALDTTTQSRLLIAGGTTSQVLQKTSNTDYDVSWATVAAATAVSYAPQTLSSPEQLQARTNIGLSNVDNTNDSNKPVSTATQTALNLKGSLAGTNTWTGAQTFQSAAFTTAAVNLTVGQISFPVTQNPSANVNTLDDYREGTTTPTVTSDVGTIATSSCTLNFTKIGRLVSFSAIVNITTAGTGEGAINVPIPFTASFASSGSAREVGVTGVACAVSIGGSSCRITRYDNDTIIASGHILHISGSYIS